MSFTSLKRLLWGRSPQKHVIQDPQGGPCLVLVHLGPQWMPYINECIAQALKFNSRLPIYFAASKVHRGRLSSEFFANEQLRYVELETLSSSKTHKKFLKRSKLDTEFRGGFWKFATERFFILDEVVSTYGLKDCFHIENDNVVYASFSELVPVFHQNAVKMAAPFDNDERCIPSFVYFRDAEASGKLVTYLAKASRSEALNDMQTLALYRKKQPGEVTPLPIVPNGYECDWTTPSGKKSQEPWIYTHLADQFGSIFDAAALGQFIGGVDGPDRKIGFINESCVFNPSALAIDWSHDQQGRRIPYVIWKGMSYRINNLHIHSKELHKFRS